MDARLIQRHAHDSHERSKLNPLSRAADSDSGIGIEIPEGGMIPARHGDYSRRSSRTRTQSETWIELRGRAGPGRPSPSSGAYAMDTDFKGHAGLGAIDRNRTSEGMSDVVRQIARRKVIRFAETGFLLDRAPPRVEGLKCNHVAGIDDQRGL